MELSVDTTPKTPSGCGSFAGKGVATIFFGLFFLLGALFTFFIVGEAFKQVAPWWWPESDCTILSSSVGETEDDQHPYRALVRYRYEVDGQSHESERMFRGDDGTASFDRARNRAARYQPGAVATCRVSPSYPALAVLERRVPWIAIAVIFPLIFVAIGGFGLYATWRAAPSGKGPTVESISQGGLRAHDGAARDPTRRVHDLGRHPVHHRELAYALLVDRRRDLVPSRCALRVPGWRP
jgi:hypothetical protein